VVLADDGPVYRAGMVRALDAHPRFDLVAVVEDGEAAVEAAILHAPDLAVLDLRMPGMDGIDACGCILAHVPRLPTRCVVLSAMEDEAVVGRAQAAGAVAYLFKSTSRTELCRALLRAGSTA